MYQRAFDRVSLSQKLPQILAQQRTNRLELGIKSSLGDEDHVSKVEKERQNG